MRREKLDDVSHDEWLELRRRYIGASEVGITCGVSAWGSLAELFAEKRGLRPPKEDTNAMQRGRWGEPAVLEALAHQRPEWQVARARLMVIDDEHREACTPDAFAYRPDRDGPGIVQAKVVSRGVYRKKWLDDYDNFHGEATPPAAYWLQTLQEARLNEVKWGVLAVLINSEYTWDFRLFDVERDDVLEAHIRHNNAEFFRRYLDPNIMPPFEPQRDQALIRQLFPKDAGTTIDLSTDNRAAQLVEDLTETQAGLKRLKTQCDIIRTELESKLGANTFGTLADGRCLSWKLQHRKAHTVAASDFRVLRLLKSKPEDEDDE